MWKKNLPCTDPKRIVNVLYGLYTDQIRAEKTIFSARICLLRDPTCSVFLPGGVLQVQGALTLVRRVTIHYNCIGTFEVPAYQKVPEWDILLETRKGVALSYAPAQIAI